MLEKEFVPYDESLELKELGFDEPCIAYHNKPNDKSLCFVDLFGFIKEKWIEDYHVNSLEKKVSAPTFSQAFRWFREKYEIAGEVNNYYLDGKWSYNYDIVTKYKEKASDMFDKHEDAELACLRKLIEIVKNK